MKLSSTTTATATATFTLLIGSISWLLPIATAQNDNNNATTTTNPCYGNMITADASNNGFLEVSEFYTLVDLQACDAYTLPTDDNLNELNTQFQALACTSCIATGDGGLTCCFRDLEQARISIAGANNTNDNPPTLVQQVSLDSICTSIDLIITSSVCNTTTTTGLEDLIPPLGELVPTLAPNNDMVPAPPTLEDIDLPGVNASTADMTCLGNLTAADADNDTYLNSAEFYQFIVLRGAAVCYEGEVDGALTDVQLGVFSSLACTSCLANNDGGFTCCFRPTEEARISVAGASDGAAASDVQIASLTSICTAVDAIVLAGESCQEAGDGGGLDLFPTPALPSLPPISIGFEDVPEQQEDCFADMATADSNADEYLDLDEFLNFVVLQGAETCYELPSDTSELLNEFNLLACGSCLTNNDGGLTCCTRPTDEARISIAGAADNTTRTDLQTVTLIGICIAVQEGYVGLSNCEGIPEVDVVTPSLPPIDVGFENQTDCYPDIVTADADTDEWLNATEFLQLIVLGGSDICYEPEVAGELTTAQAVSFQALACTSCLANGDGGLLCCTRSLEEARISVSGAYSPEDNSAIQDGFLASICTTVETLLVAEESACSDTSPESTESPPTNATTPETDETDSPPDDVMTESPEETTTPAPVPPTTTTPPATTTEEPTASPADDADRGDLTDLTDTSGTTSSHFGWMVGLSVALLSKYVV